MSFDPFEARMQFLQMLRKLNASQASLQKVVGFAIKYGSRCGEDLWECIMEESGRGSLNSRINLFYLLDTLLEHSQGDTPYPRLIASNLTEVVEKVVPPGEGVLNIRSARQILESWRLRRLLEPHVVDEALAVLSTRQDEPSRKRSITESFSRGDIVRRMEEDRERHKRLRERIWILPIPPLQPLSRGTTSSNTNTNTTSIRPPSKSPASASPFTPVSPKGTARSGSMSVKKKSMPPPATPKTAAATSAAPAEDEATALDVEFDQLWEGASDLDEEDLEFMREDAQTAGLDLT